MLGLLWTLAMEKRVSVGSKAFDADSPDDEIPLILRHEADAERSLDIRMETGIPKPSWAERRLLGFPGAHVSQQSEGPPLEDELRHGEEGGPEIVEGNDDQAEEESVENAPQIVYCAGLDESK